MTDQDRAVTRRAIADALLTALERRHEVLDAIVESADRESAAMHAAILREAEDGAASCRPLPPRRIDEAIEASA